LSATLSPGPTFVTPSPTSRTVPAPSCPSTAGSVTGMMPSRAARSLWHNPTAATFTSTSPGLGASRVSVSRVNSAKGLCAPAAVIPTVPPQSGAGAAAPVRGSPSATPHPGSGWTLPRWAAGGGRGAPHARRRGALLHDLDVDGLDLLVVADG